MEEHFADSEHHFQLVHFSQINFHYQFSLPVPTQEGGNACLHPHSPASCVCGGPTEPAGVCSYVRVLATAHWETPCKIQAVAFRSLLLIKHHLLFFYLLPTNSRNI